MSLGALVPLVVEAARPVVAQALASQRGNGGSILGSSEASPGLDIRATLAEAQMGEPGFWMPPKMDLEKAVLIAVIGFAGGHILGKSMR